MELPNDKQGRIALFLFALSGKGKTKISHNGTREKGKTIAKP
jgi:hypothetical protein